MKKAKSSRRALKVQGAVLPPVVLRALLPDVATVVKDAMTVEPSKQAQPSAPDPQDTNNTCKPRTQARPSAPESQATDNKSKRRTQEQPSDAEPENTDKTCESRTQAQPSAPDTQDTNNTCQPRTQAQPSAPELQATDNKCKPRTQEQPRAAEPENTDKTCEPRTQAQPSAPDTQDTDNTCKPRTQAQPSAPELQATDNKCIPRTQAHPSTAAPQNTDNTCKPLTQAQYSAPEPQDTDSTCKPRTQKNILNPFPCNICKLRFPSRNTLKTHILSHEFECHICRLALGSRNLYLKHQCCICKTCNKPCANANHKNCPKVFTCKCGKKFTRRRDFTAHQKIHFEIYGHCPTCAKQFTKETDLINHVNKMKLPCIYCGACFPNLEELSAHKVETPKPPKYSCKICDEIFEDSLSATSHSRTHAAPMRSYSRKPKAVNAQERRRELVSIIVNEENLIEVPIEFYKDPEPQKRVKGKLDDHEDNNFSKHAKVKEEPCDKRFNEDLERGGGVDEPKLKCVKVEFEVDEETRDPNQKGIGITKPLKQLGGIKVEPDFSDEDMRDAIEKVDGLATEESSKLFGAVKIEPEVRKEIKKEPNGRLELLEVGFDEVMNEEHDVKAWPLRLSTTGLYAGHQIVDGLASGPVRVERAPRAYAGKDALRKKTACMQAPARTNPPTTDQLLEPSSIKLELVEEIEAVDIKSQDIYN